MKTQTYIVLRSTLTPAEDMVWVELKPKSRGGDEIKGRIEIFCRPSESPKAGDEVTVEVKWLSKEEKEALEKLNQPLPPNPKPRNTGP